MFKIVKKEIIWGGKKLSIETGKIARQADGAVILTSGDTVILATVVGAKKANPETDFFPLTVNYQEKYYASGKIPGGYFKREARPTESETLISRLIDRPIRPLFPEGFRNEVQVLPTVLSYEKDNDPEILSLIAASAALSISGIPFMGPVAASKVGYINGSFVLNPTKEQLKDSQLELIVAGTKDAVLMVESEASGLTEKIMLDAVKFGHEQFGVVIKMINEFSSECSKEKWIVEEKDLNEVKSNLLKNVKNDLIAAFSEADKKKRGELINLAKEKSLALYKDSEQFTEMDVESQFKNIEKEIVRTKILKEKKRIDGRGLADIRPIKCEVGILPRAHGSALFTRG
ncbi:MAG: polyribonucleotide nucleotidyltransferase, partial [Candidatus Fonsibacter ubiquis]